jgi:hypothetical protein
MKYKFILLFTCLFINATLLQAANASDAPNADCNVREDGENKKKKSGPCTVTKTQGNIWILLANGDSFTLKPRDKEDRYKDQKGRDVKVKYEAGNPVYTWEHRHITVNMRNPGRKN